MKISEVKAIVKSNGGHFFDKDTMKFWGTRIETGVIKNGCFVTSENSYDGTKRFYTVCRFNGKSIDTIQKNPQEEPQGFIANNRRSTK